MGAKKRVNKTIFTVMLVFFRCPIKIGSSFTVHIVSVTVPPMCENILLQAKNLCRIQFVFASEENANTALVHLQRTRH